MRRDPSFISSVLKQHSTVLVFDYMACPNRINFKFTYKSSVGNGLQPQDLLQIIQQAASFLEEQFLTINQSFVPKSLTEKLFIPPTSAKTLVWNLTVCYVSNKTNKRGSFSLVTPQQVDQYHLPLLSKIWAQLLNE